MTAVADWQDHVRSGGRTTWREWRAAGGAPPPRPVAVQLEVCRRLAGLVQPFPASLADLVFATGASGRGPVDQPVVGQDDRFGPRAVEPDELPAAELLRVASAVLAASVDRRPVRRPPTPPVRRYRVRRPRFRVRGAPLSAAAVRRVLLADGWREADPTDARALELWLLRPPGAMVLEQWSGSVAAGGGVSWQRVWIHAARTGEPPRSLAALAALASPSAGDRHVVVADDAAGVVAGALRVAGVGSAPLVRAPSPEAVEARRRVNRLRYRRAAPAGLFGAAELTPAPALGVPDVGAAYAGRFAEEIADRVHAGGYPVHGDPKVLRRRTDAPAHPDLDGVLALTLRAIAVSWGRPRSDTKQRTEDG